MTLVTTKLSIRDNFILTQFRDLRRQNVKKCGTRTTSMEDTE